MFRLISVCAVFLISVMAHAETISGRVVGVSDGDTIKVLAPGNQQVKVRMAQIDAPEKDQPYGQASKKSLSDMVFGKTVELRVQDRDRYGRTVATVVLDGRDINRAQVEAGAAWVYRQYLKDRSLIAVEDAAKAQGKGLWALQADQRMPPWEWRRAKKGGSTAAPAVSKAGECGSKRTCKQMSSCDEAKFYLKTCGVKSLDGDGDGVPCASLCR